ncbi:glycosyltransferase family 39 protein [Flexilinea flocculi]|uniref:Dolichyl-phosphate-mannose-protein mannosyltransferase n=1 Tax=Flexilinea flocculi TaxID=1678840 RepID=A0A0K8PB76_9CHLR|nr:glycosyltransferase family 39 protein [Flexilinea flocculi]GAP39913.1 dolichyl-phosphate-mannose-protein mannosyltransferase [Flexilinea flocculi]
MKVIFCSRRNDCYLILTVLLSILIRFMFFVIFLRAGFSDDFSLHHYPDSVTYAIPADSILNQGKFLNQQQQPEIFRTPGYPLFLAFCKLISAKNWIWAAIILQLLLNTVSVVVLYEIIWALSRNSKASFFGSLIAAFNLHDVYFCFFILSDSIAQSILIIAVFFLIRFFQKQQTVYLLLAAALLSTGTFIRPAGLYLPLLLAFLIFFYYVQQKMSVKALAIAILFLSIGFIPEFLWQLRNEQAAGYSGFSAIQEENLYSYHAAGIFAEKNGTSFYQEQENLKNDPKVQELTRTMSLQEAQRKIAFEVISENLPTYLYLNLKGAGYILFYPGLFDIAQIYPSFRNYIANMKSEFLSDFSQAEQIRNFLSNPFSILTLLNGFLLVTILVFTFWGIQRSFSSGIPLQINLMLLCFMIYFLLIHAGPNGFGTYPRFRLSISMLQTIYVGLFFAKMNKKDGKTEAIAV